MCYVHHKEGQSEMYGSVGDTVKEVMKQTEETWELRKG